jgi:hypothetical protein
MTGREKFPEVIATGAQGSGEPGLSEVEWRPAVSLPVLTQPLMFIFLKGTAFRPYVNAPK